MRCNALGGGQRAAAPNSAMRRAWNASAIAETGSGDERDESTLATPRAGDRIRGDPVRSLSNRLSEAMTPGPAAEIDQLVRPQNDAPDFPRKGSSNPATRNGSGPEELEGTDVVWDDAVDKRQYPGRGHAAGLCGSSHR